MIEGLKEALKIGTQNAARTLGKENGYYEDPTVFIDLPPEAATAMKVTGVVSEIAGNPLAKTLIQALEKNDINLSIFSSDLSGNLISAFNRGAEKAAPKAVDIFVSAITGMKIDDGKKILFSENNYAARDYLQTTTSESLTTAFSPVINGTIKEINISIGGESYDALGAWSFYAEQNNKLEKLVKSKEVGLILDGLNLFLPEQVKTIRSIKEINTDLGGHVVGKAMDGIFLKIGGEEQKIRTDVNARVNDLLREVFGQLDNQ